MIAEEDEYYDSIDDSEFESCRSFCNAQFQDDDSDIDDNIKLGSLVPFYTGNVEVDSIKNESKSNSSTNLKRKLKRRNHKYLLPSLEKQKNRSYLTIFYSRTGVSKSREPSVVGGSRGTCTELSEKCCLSCDQDKTSLCCYFDRVDHSKRFYEKFMENGNNRRDDDNYDNENLSMPHSTSSSVSKLYSVSAVLLNPAEKSKKESGIKLNKNATRTKSFKVCELGGLGPNIAQEKLELLRRRQNYGKTVSQKNRLKIMESKVVQKLKEEIRESHKF